MHERVRELIGMLRLEPHPEGGHYRETFRSADRVQPDDGRPARSGLTTILFLLGPGEHSRWHRVGSAEAWHHYEGDDLELLVAPPDLRQIAVVRLGRASATVRPAYTLPAHWWQAARPVGDYALCGCNVGPGFDFADFSFLRDDTAASTRLRALDAEAARLL